MVDQDVPPAEGNRLRVLHIQKTHGIGGSERHIIDLCSGLRARGADARILWLAAPTRPLATLAELCRRRGVPARELPIRGDLDPRLPRAIRVVLKEQRPHILHLHLIHATLYGVLAARGHSLPIVATRHGTEAYQRLPWLRLLARALDARCARIIAPSAWVAQYARRWDGTPEAKLRVIPHGIDPAAYARPRAAQSAVDAACVVTTVARLHPSKDHATLIEAFGVVAEGYPGVRLQIVGDGPLRGRLERLAARRLGSALQTGAVRFLGERDDIPEILANSDLVVLPGAREGFGLAALEAMAAGLPVVAPASGALPELIQDHADGRLVPPGDPAALAAAIIALVRDPQRRLELGRRARQTAARFSLDRMVAATASLYAELVPDPGAPRGAAIDTPRDSP